MEIKSQNLSKMTNEQLYRLVVQKEISDAERALVRSELVKREAEVLYNRAQRARPGEAPPAPTGLTVKGPGGLPGAGAKRKFNISPTQWLVIILMVIVLAAVVYAAVIR